MYPFLLVFLIFTIGTATSAQAQSAYQTKRFQPFLTRGETTWSISAGARKSDFKWSRAADITGTVAPNVASEQTWTDTTTAELKAKVRHTKPLDIFFIRGGLQLEAEITAGLTMDGRGRLSSYLGNNRSLEFARQTFKENGGDAIGGAVSAGYKINLTGTPGRRAREIMASPAPRTARGRIRKERALQQALYHAGPYISITPLVGYAANQQTYTRENAYQHIPSADPDAPPVGPFHTESEFIANWYGPFIGLEGEIKTRKNMLRLRGEYHDLTYYGKGIEPSRADDLEQDPSYDHEADGQGILLNAEYAYALADDYAITFDATWLKRKSDAGTYTLYPRTGNDITARLNEAEDKSAGLRIGLRYNWN